uniref:Uncharacterized protein n=1 Tax=uncultured bacterium 270 TaxID=698387 RepID=E3T6U5_9BACT|nr:protein of unknown function DUF72 [uncultured bacterium 270]
MARLADHGSGVQAAQQSEEAADATRVEFERWWQLNEQRPKRIAEPDNFAQELLQRVARTGQRALVGYQLRDLDGEAEGRGHSSGPAPVDRLGVRPVEGAVDLGRVQPARVALELRACRGKAAAMDARDVPAGAADIGGHAREQSR